MIQTITMAQNGSFPKESDNSHDMGVKIWLKERVPHCMIMTICYKRYSRFFYNLFVPFSIDFVHWVQSGISRLHYIIGFCWCEFDMKLKILYKLRIRYINLHSKNLGIACAVGLWVGRTKLK